MWTFYLEKQISEIWRKAHQIVIFLYVCMILFFLSQLHTDIALHERKTNQEDSKYCVKWIWILDKQKYCQGGIVGSVFKTY